MTVASERRVCRVLEIDRSVHRYRSMRQRSDEPLRTRLKLLAQTQSRWGLVQLTRVLRRDLPDNHKRIERMYREERLQLAHRRRKRPSWVKRASVVVMQPTAPNERWSMDFIHDTLSNGRRFKVLTIIDHVSRECPGLEVDTSIRGWKVAEVLDRIAEWHPLPKEIVVDNGPEFRSMALDQWAYERGITLRFIEPGKPTQNAFIESFNGRVRDECLNQHWFQRVDESKQLIEAWRNEYNSYRPHGSLGGLTPEEFLRRRSETCQQMVG